MKALANLSIPASAISFSSSDTSLMVVAFELLFGIKELQLQHGLRSDDFARYHSHCSARIRTLRKQLKLSSDYKKVTKVISQGAASGKPNRSVPFQSPKPVNSVNATTPSHILLMALAAERAWAESQQAAQAAAGTTVHQQQTSATRHTTDGGRKRLNKAKSLAYELLAVCTTIGDARLAIQAKAYAEMMGGRCAIAHARYDEALKHFTDARESLLKLRPTSTQSQWDVALVLIVECDDRLSFAHQHLGIDSPYAAPPVEQGVDSGPDSAIGANVLWNNRTVPVLCLRAKQMLRLVHELDAELSAQQILDAVRGVEKTYGLISACWTLFQMQSPYNRALDALDRTVAAYNDALDSVRHDLRESSGTIATTSGVSSVSERTRALRALQLYLQFHTYRATITRTVLVTSSFTARFHLSQLLLDLSGAKPTLKLTLPVPLPEMCPQFFADVVTPATVAPPAGCTKQYKKSRREFSFGPQHIASPPEIERLCDTTIRIVTEAVMLPGVEGDASIVAPLESAKALAIVQRYLYTAEGWLLVARVSKAEHQVPVANEQLSNALGCARDALKSAKGHAFVEAPLYERYADALCAAIAAESLSPADEPVDSITYHPSLCRSVQLRDVNPTDEASYASEHPMTFTVQSGFARVPPGFLSMPAKPAFVDVAATYLAPKTTEDSSADVGAQKPAAPTASEVDSVKKTNRWGFGLWKR